MLLADYVIANRSKLPKLQNRRHGTVSAYLKIMYQQLGAEQVTALVEPLANAKVDRAREQLLTWQISTNGHEETLKTGAPDADADYMVPGGGFSPLRAAIRSGEIAFFFDKLAALPEADRNRYEMGIAQSVIDVDDESKKALGTEALTRKLYVLAGSFAAIQDDPDAWLAFLSAQNDKNRAERLTSMLYWLPALKGKPALPRPAAPDSQGQMVRTLIHETTIAAARIPERDYLMTYLNQTGDFAGAGRAAAAIIDLTRDGGTIDMETAWLVIYESLVESSGNRAEMDKKLKNIPVISVRFGGDNVREVLDHMLAIEALKAHTANGGASRPPDLQGASADFEPQYKAWQDAAAVIAAGGDLAALRSSGQKLLIAANLLFASGRHEQLAKFLTSTVPNSDSIRLAELFAEALDRHCNGYLAFPAEAVLMQDTPMFRFEPQA
ncbi:MAG: hypothetical protein JWL86_4228 [Rhizobium sp.]|nr:hypothetical protein [Rhizobium sp.]